jgi:microsomal dipeptidase-like Zn-dependent dipeptidase
MSRANIAVDLSHASHHLARDVLELLRSERLRMLPIATHSGCHAVFEHPRNLPDDVLEELAALGGYIGIPLFGPLVAPEGTSIWYYAGAHVRRALDICGEEAVGIGSDCQHFDMTYAEAEKLFADLVAMVKPTGPAYFPDRPRELIEHGNEMGRFIDKHICQRFPEGVGRGIAGKNFRSYLARQL